VFFVPLERENPTIKIPWTVYSLIAVNLLVFLWAVVNPDYQEVVLRYGFTPAHQEMSTVLTSMFLHASLLHLAGNMFFLWMFGDNIEDVLRPVLFLVIYTLCGFGAAFAHYLSGPESAIPMVGASGAVSGIMGLYMVFFPRVKVDLVLTYMPVRKGGIRTSAFFGIGLWLLGQFLLAILLQSGGKGEYVGVAFWAHVGGLLTGIVLGYYLLLLEFKKRFDRKLKKFNLKSRRSD